MITDDRVFKNWIHCKTRPSSQHRHITVRHIVTVVLVIENVITVTGLPVNAREEGAVCALEGKSFYPRLALGGSALLRGETGFPHVCRVGVEEMRPAHTLEA